MRYYLAVTLKPHVLPDQLQTRGCRFKTVKKTAAKTSETIGPRALGITFRGNDMPEARTVSAS
jgi:hypothetical protein